ncbi:MAG TPA: hypothetical protein VE596_16885 [Gaiellaceae bacterium]|nr:hypothetical protein [Gaiellaceae bacterium]
MKVLAHDRHVTQREIARRCEDHGDLAAEQVLDRLLEPPAPVPRQLPDDLVVETVDEDDDVVRRPRAMPDRVGLLTRAHDSVDVLAELLAGELLQVERAVALREHGYRDHLVFRELLDEPDYTARPPGARSSLDDDDGRLFPAASDCVSKAPARSEPDDRRLTARPLHELCRLVARVTAVPPQRLLALAPEDPIDRNRRDGCGNQRMR